MKPKDKRLTKGLELYYSMFGHKLGPEWLDHTIDWGTDALSTHCEKCGMFVCANGPSRIVFTAPDDQVVCNPNRRRPY